MQQTIQVGESVFKAYRCPICGMRASDPATIMVCEAKHEKMRKYMRGNGGMEYFDKHKAEPEPCDQPGCDRKAMARGYCSMHYMMQWQSGELS